MITDAINRYTFKIKINTYNQWGGCVVFKASESSMKYCLLTAKHNLFQGKDYLNYIQETLNVSNLDIEILNENNKIHEKINANKAFFFRNEEDNSCLDLALIIFDGILVDFAKLNFYDTDDEKQNNHIYCAAGYPNYLEEIHTDNKLNFYYLKPISKYKHNIEMVINTDNSLNFYDSEFNDKLKGMSGSGIFLLGKNGEVALRSIIYKVIPTNKFECIKLDEILDQINERLSESDIDKIQTITKPLLINDEVFNLSELANIENIRKFIMDSSELDYNGINTQDDIRKKAKELNKEYSNTKSVIDKLSYQYAHLALLAHSKNMQLATTRFFKKAIDLNPNHITTFLLEKSEGQKNKTTQEINEITPIDAKGLSRKYTQLIELENNNENKTKLLKEVIENLSYFKDNSEIRIFMDNFSNQLEDIYSKNKTFKVIFKYQDLADFYHKIPQKYSRALYYNYLSLEIINLFSNPDGYKDFSSKIYEKISSLERFNETGMLLSSDEKIEMKNKAKILLLEEEDQSLKELLNKISHDIFTLNLRNLEQEDVTREIINSLVSLSIQNNNIAFHTQNNKLDIDASNQNNDEIKSSAIMIKDLINAIPAKYDIKIDDKTRYELCSIIEEPAEIINVALNKINAITDNTVDYIKTSENSFKEQVSHEKEELSVRHNDIKVTLDVFSQKNKKVDLDKNEVLLFLRNSERRMLANIHKININAIHENETVSFIQRCIAKLENNTTVISIKQAESNVKKELETVINICQALEKNILELNESHSYKKDLNSIKKGQIRIEHTLIKKTVEALSTHIQNNEALTEIRHNQEKLEQALLNNANDIFTPDRNHRQITSEKTIVNQRKKILLIGSTIMAITAAIYFTVF